MSFIIAANWKMNKGPKETRQFFDTFKEINSDPSIKTLFFVPAVDASETARSLSQTSYGWGPQNIFPAGSGAFTGETSPQVMSELGARYVLVGHSERRQLFFETDEQTNVKIHSALDFDLSPILCVGETLSERKNGTTLEVLNRQLVAALSNVQIKNELHIAYEPVWAIGTGEVANTEQVSEAHQSIRSFLKEKYPDQQQKIKILYGGSVKPNNAEELSKAQEVGGFLVGGASLKPDSFVDIIKAVQG